MSEVKHLLEAELEEELKELAKMDLGGDEYKTTVDGVSKLMDKLNDSKKIELEALEKEASRMQDAEIKMEQIKEEKKGRIMQTVTQALTTVLGIVIPVGLTIWGTKTTLEYEDKGIIPERTAAGKAFNRKLFKDKV